MSRAIRLPSLAYVPRAAAFGIFFILGCDSGSDGKGPTARPSTPTQGQPTTTAPVASAPAAASASDATPATSAKGPFPESTNPLLREPQKAKDRAPATFKVKFETTQGDFEVQCQRDW